MPQEFYRASSRSVRLCALFTLVLCSLLLTACGGGSSGGSGSSSSSGESAEALRAPSHAQGGGNSTHSSGGGGGNNNGRGNQNRDQEETTDGTADAPDETADEPITESPDDTQDDEVADSSPDEKQNDELAEDDFSKTPTSVSLSWELSLERENGDLMYHYEVAGTEIVYRREDESTFSGSYFAAEDRESATIEGLEPGTYFFAARTQDIEGQWSTYSNELEIHLH